MNRSLLIGIVCLGTAVLVPLFAGGYLLYLLTLICAYGLVACGLNLLTGSTGLVSLGHAGFFAIGAYTTAVLVDVYGAPYAVGFLCAILVCGAFGILVGLPAIRLKGFYLAIATLAFGIGVERVIYSARTITGGPYGLSTSRPGLLGFSLNSDASVYLFGIALSAVGIVLLANIMARRPGRMIIALRDNQIAAISMGVNATRTKLIVFAISAMYAGVGGALYAAVLGFISTEHFTLWLSISFVAMIVIGGLGSIAGSFIGAAFVVLIPELLRGIREYQDIVFGSAMVLIFMLWPTGLIGAVRIFGSYIGLDSKAAEPVVIRSSVVEGGIND
jgi:branched-chain amino acid transport system permease protein